MSFVTALFVYFLIWWVMLFTVLPIGVERHVEDGKGFDAGAPKVPDLKKKIILNSILSAVILIVIHLLVVYGVIDMSRIYKGEF